MSEKANSESETYRCPLCGKAFETIRATEAHISGSKDETHSGSVGKNFRGEIERGERVDQRGLLGRTRDRVGGLLDRGGSEPEPEEQESDPEPTSRSDSTAQEDGEMEEMKKELRRGVMDAILSDDELRKRFAMGVVDDMAEWVVDDTETPSINAEVDSLYQLMAYEAWNNPDKTAENIGLIASEVGEKLGEGARSGFFDGEAGDFSEVLGGAGSELENAEGGSEEEQDSEIERASMDDFLEENEA